MVLKAGVSSLVVPYSDVSTHQPVMMLQHHVAALMDLIENKSCGNFYASYATGVRCPGGSLHQCYELFSLQGAEHSVKQKQCHSVCVR